MNKMKLVILCSVTLVVLVLSGCFGDRLYTQFTGSNSNANSNLTENNWTYTAGRVNGRATARNILFTSQNLDSLQVAQSNFSEGSVTLILMQGNNERAFELTNSFSGNIDTSGFNPGERDSIRLRLVFDSAGDVTVVINW